MLLRKNWRKLKFRMKLQMKSVMSVDAIWSSNTDHMEDSLHVPGFPECRNTKPYYEKIGVACPKCGKDVVLKKTQKGRKYYGCIDNPECDFMSWQKPSAKKCPVCGSYMVEKGNKIVCSETTCGYVEQKSKEDKYINFLKMRTKSKKI